MSYETVTYDREKLYQEVWAEPISQLAKKYGLSDVGLAKVCKKLKVPRPERGYWARLQAGKRVDAPPKLSPLPGLQSLTVERRIEEQDPLDPETEKLVIEMLAAENLPKNQIRVGKRLSSPHPLVQEAEAIFSGKKTYHWNDERRHKHLAVDVSKERLPRALRIMDALVKAFEKRGFPVTIEKERGSDWRYQTRVGILGETISIRLREMLKQVKVEDSKWSRIDLVHNGKLELQVNATAFLADAGGTERLLTRINSTPS